MKKKIGFIGIGVMGKPIVQHLMKNGYTVYGYSRTKEKLLDQIDAGMIWCNTIATVSQHAEIIFTMVGFPSDVESVYFKHNGLLANAQNGQIFIDMTTSKPDLAMKISLSAQQLSATALDAPVTGGDLGAINGTLSMMIGGDEAILTTILPILELFTQNVQHVGPSGYGQHAKMANQIAICGTLLGTAESLVYCKSTGVPAEKMLKIMADGSASSWQLIHNGSKMLVEDFTPGFFLKHFLKDLKIALAEISKYQMDLPILKHGVVLCQQLVDDGLGEQGTQIIINGYHRKNS